MKSLIELENERAEWSAKIFPQATAHSSLIKARQEIEEIQDDLDNGEPKAEEYVDALMCIFDSAKRAGFSAMDIRNSYEAKNHKNIHEREWLPNGDGTYSHIK